MGVGGEAGEGEGGKAAGYVIVAGEGEGCEGAGEHDSEDGGKSEGEEDEGEVFSRAVEAFEHAEGVQEDGRDEEVGRGGGGELEGEQAGELEVGPEVGGGADGEEVFD